MLFVRNVTFMTGDPRRLADFWSSALELPERVDKADEIVCADKDWRYPRLTFQRAADSDRRSCRVHLDLTADDRTNEVQRLTSLGASAVREVSEDDGWSWTVMTDPDGNEFCVTDP